MIIYEINKDKRVVVARFEGGKEYWRSSLWKMCTNILDNTYTSKVLGHFATDTIVDAYTDFIGKATCHLYDEWDENVGKQIAKDRLLQKWNKIKEEVLTYLRSYVVQNYNWTLDRIDKKLYKRRG